MGFFDRFKKSKPEPVAKERVRYGSEVGLTGLNRTSGSTASGSLRSGYVTEEWLRPLQGKWGASSRS